MIPYYSAENFSFPPLETALQEPDGLLAAGGLLSTEQLLLAYQSGIFPWYSEGDPIMWWSPSIRAVFWPKRIHTSRSLAKFLRRSPYTYSFNRAFPEVIESCARVHEQTTGTWITPQMIHGYSQLHYQGHAHSVEVWQNEKLVGGLYGILVGQVFCGESMFHRADHASKCALLALAQHLTPLGLQLIDCQLPNPHLMRLGAEEMPRGDFIQQLARFKQHTIASYALKPQFIEL